MDRRKDRNGDGLPIYSAGRNAKITDKRLSVQLIAVPQSLLRLNWRRASTTTCAAELCFPRLRSLQRFF